MWIVIGASVVTLAAVLLIVWAMCKRAAWADAEIERWGRERREGKDV